MKNIIHWLWVAIATVAIAFGITVVVAGVAAANPVVDASDGFANAQLALAAGDVAGAANIAATTVTSVSVQFQANPHQTIMEVENYFTPEYVTPPESIEPSTIEVAPSAPLSSPATIVEQIDTALGQALPEGSKLPDVAQTIGDKAWQPVYDLFGAEGVAPKKVATASDASLSEQSELVRRMVMPIEVAPDAAMCSDSADIYAQAACSGAMTLEWRQENDMANTRVVVTPKYGVNAWINPETSFVCGYIPGMGMHGCDNAAWFDSADPRMINNDVEVGAAAAHEFGHTWQERRGHNVVGNTMLWMFNIDESAPFADEQKSDCDAGSWARTLSPEDATVVFQQFYDLGVDDDESHGSKAERLAAVKNGYYNGMSACGVYMN